MEFRFFLPFPQFQHIPREGQVNAMDVGEKRLAQQQDTNEGEKLSTEPPATTVGATTVSESQDNPGDKVPSQKRVRPNEDEAASNAPTAEQPDAKGERLHICCERGMTHTLTSISRRYLEGGCTPSDGYLFRR